MPKPPLPKADSVLVTAAALVGGLLVAQQVAGRALRDALFLSAYSVLSLPGMMLVSAMVSVLGSLAFATALARRAPAAVLTAALAVQAALLLGEWRLAEGHPRLVAAAVYIQVALLGPGLVSGFWSLVNELFDPHTARSAVGRIGTGASLGGVLGGALAWLGTRVVAVPSLLLGLFATCVLALLSLDRLRSAGAAPQRDAVPAEGVSGGVRSIREFPYLQNLAALVAIGALAEALLDYLVKAGAARAFADGAELARFFSLFYACVALLTLAVQATLTRRSLERVGLSGTVSLQPGVVALASAAGVAFPTLGAAVLARGLGSTLRDSLFRSGYELFYAPLPPWQKRRSKALVDVAADKLGTLLGAGLVMALTAVGLSSERWLWLLALLAMSASVLLARMLHRGYVAALESSLRSGLVALEPDEVMDSTTRLTMTRTALDRGSLLAEIRSRYGELQTPPQASSQGPSQAPQGPVSTSSDPYLRTLDDLRSGQAERIRGALRGLDVPDPGVAHLLVPLLARDDLFPDVLRLLRRAAPRITGQLVDALLDPEQPLPVRRRIPRVLKASPTQRALAGLVAGLGDPEFAVRRSCSAILAWMRERHPELEVPGDPLYAAVASELAAPEPNAEAQLDHVFALLAAVGEVEPLRVSRWALRGEDPRLRGTALEYLDQVLPDEVRQPLLRRLGAARETGPRPRALDEVEDELMRSAVSLPRGLIARWRRS